MQSAFAPNQASLSSDSSRTSRFDRANIRRAAFHVVDSRAATSAVKAQRTARIDMLAIFIALAAAALVRFNVIPGIGW